MLSAMTLVAGGAVAQDKPVSATTALGGKGASLQTGAMLTATFERIVGSNGSKPAAAKRSSARKPQSRSSRGR